MLRNMRCSCLQPGSATCRSGGSRENHISDSGLPAGRVHSDGLLFIGRANVFSGVLLRLCYRDPMGRIERFSPNTIGRDFVAGDVHGQFHLLSEQLDRFAFDSRNDRLFCVGDLIDRGRDSQAAVRWLEYSWFHCVRGNHEQMALDAQSDSNVRFTWMLNGGEWWDDTPSPIRRKLLSLLDALPIAIVIETAHAPVGIVHADLPPETRWSDFLDQVERGDRNAINTALWSRRRVYNRNNTGVPGAAEIYCGHTIVDVPLTLGNVHFIDTGAYTTGRLTVVRL